MGSPKLNMIAASPIVPTLRTLLTISGSPISISYRFPYLRPLVRCRSPVRAAPHPVVPCWIHAHRFIRNSQITGVD